MTSSLAQMRQRTHHPSDSSMARVVDQLLSILAEAEFADRLIVFGSVAAGSHHPRDIDVALDASDCENQGEAAQKHAAALQRLIILARRNYGHFDPFIMTRSDLFVRNDIATAWQRSKNKRELLAAIRGGIRLTDLTSEAKDVAATPAPSMNA